MSEKLLQKIKETIEKSAPLYEVEDVTDDLVAVFVGQDLDCSGFSFDPGTGRYHLGFSFDDGMKTQFIQLGHDKEDALKLAFELAAYNKKLRILSADPYIAIDVEAVRSISSDLTKAVVCFRGNQHAFAVNFDAHYKAEEASNKMNEAFNNHVKGNDKMKLATLPATEKIAPNVIRVQFDSLRS